MKMFFAIAASLLLLSACSKKNSDDICFDGVVRWAGNPAADGLGWVIEKDDSTNTSRYVPQNLPDEFKQEGVKVAACVRKTDERAPCFCAEPLYKYRITSIKER